MNLEGRLLGNRYEILEKIGNGGMATVYRAKCHVLNRYVAVKILRDEFTTDEEFVKRFEVEAQAAASITNPNIVSVYDVGVDGSLHYIVMELIKGKTLKEIILEERGPISWKWAVNIAMQIASALEIAHRNKIVHRDIKPHNIIITEDGIAKVTDFGIAKAVSNSTITAFGKTMGSVHYISPEHAKGGFTDTKSDLYSLGVVLYEMVTGKVPFEADTPISVALKHMQEQAISPIEKNPDIPKAINDIILKALRKDTSLRYQSAGEMLVDLRRALKDPYGDFVNNSSFQDFATQKFDIMYGEEIKTEELNVGKRSKNKKENKFVRLIKEHKVIFTGLLLILVFALCLSGVMLYFNLTKLKEIQIPNLVGKTIQEAQNILKENNIEYKLKEEEYNTEYESGIIISQDPPYVENRKIKEQSAISVIVSKGTEKTTMPKVVGMKKDEAEAELNTYKLKAEIIEEKSEKIEAGYITKQETDEGTELNAGETVKIYVSIGTGLEQVVVPPVVGKNEEDAKKALEEAKLKVEFASDENTVKANGTVLKQSIEAGSTVDEGTTVIITINRLTETKYGTVNVNVKSITGYKEPTTPPTDQNTTNNVGDGNTTDEVNNTTTTKPQETKIPTVKLKVTVTSEGVTETAYEKEVSQANTNVPVSISGKGTVTIKVYIDGVAGGRTYELNLDKENTLTVE